MLDYILALKINPKFKNLIDNTTFRLHYKFTTWMLIVASALQSAKQYFGNPIQCLVPDKISADVFNTFCWIHGTFTLPSHLTGKQGADYIYPGVGPYAAGTRGDRDLIEVTREGDEIRHAWYQWVTFILFLQAFLCYLPYFMWKTWEGGKIRLLLQDLDSQILHTDRETTHTKREVIVNYIHRNLRTHNEYVYKFVFCEFLNLVNIFGQLFLMNEFFNGHFTIYGWDVLTFARTEPQNRFDPMAKIFPKMTKCIFHNYGVSGSIQKLGGLCVLPLNVLNEKIYVFFWFWYLFLFSWTLFFFCIRIATIFSRYFRIVEFCARSKSSSREDVVVVMSRFWLGDWFIMMQLCRNMHPEIFHNIVIDLRNKIDPKLSENMEESKVTTRMVKQKMQFVDIP